MNLLAYVCILLFNLSLSLQANQDLPVQEESWNSIPVIWLEDNRFPTYHISLYFAQGALGEDSEKNAGLTHLTFDLLKTGTSQYAQKEIADLMDYYGVSTQHSVTHEYSVLTYSGLVDQLQSSTKLICHLLTEANYPIPELQAAKGKMKSILKNLAASPRDLADHVFRAVKLVDTPFASPAEGSLSSLDKIQSKDLVSRLKQINEKSVKRIYLRGPQKVKEIAEIFEKECRWKDQGELSSVAKVRSDDLAQLEKKKTAKIVFSNLKNSNQAQLRTGQAFSLKDYPKDYDLANFASGLLGGSFTALLMQEVRVNRGLTYSIFSQAGAQRLYARSSVNTSTKNESVVETIQAINGVFNQVREKKIDSDLIEAARRFFKGKHLMQYESSSSLLAAIISYQHIGRDYNEILTFPERVNSFDDESTLNTATLLFNPESLIYYVLGDEAVLKSLKDANLMPIEEVSYQDFL